MARHLSSKDLDVYVRELPVGPTVLARLNKLLSADATNAFDVIPILRGDPALVTSVLRLARSPFFQRATLPDTLEDAVVRLGFVELNQLVSYTVMRQLAEPLTAYGETAEFFWKKSVATGLAMEVLAEREGASPETPYLIGLLHAIGEVLVQRVVNREAKKRHQFDLTETAPSVAKQEEELLGVHQGDAAAHALRHWQFPDAIVVPIENQFAPREAGIFVASTKRLVTAKWLAFTALGEHERAATIVAQGELTATPGDDVIAAVPDLQDRIALLDALLTGMELQY